MVYNLLFGIGVPIVLLVPIARYLFFTGSDGFLSKLCESVDPRKSEFRSIEELTLLTVYIIGLTFLLSTIPIYILESLLPIFFASSDSGEGTIGLLINVAGMLAYAIGPVVGAFYVRRNIPKVKFDA